MDHEQALESGREFASAHVPEDAEGAVLFTELLAVSHLGGRREERADCIIRVLHHRGILTPSRAYERIQKCSDLGTLESWFERAFLVTDVEQLFA